MAEAKVECRTHGIDIGIRVCDGERNSLLRRKCGKVSRTINLRGDAPAVDISLTKPGDGGIFQRVEFSDIFGLLCTSLLRRDIRSLDMYSKKICLNTL